METATLTSLISLVGVLASALVASAISSRAYKREREQFRISVQRVSVEKVLEARLNAYPEFYSIVSSLAKMIFARDISLVDLEKAYVGISNWDGRHALLLSGRATSVVGDFRHYLRSTVELRDEKLFASKLMDQQYLEDILNKISAVELALKSDLGIFTAEFSELDSHVANYDQLYSRLGLSDDPATRKKSLGLSEEYEIKLNRDRSKGSKT